MENNFAQAKGGQRTGQAKGGKTEGTSRQETQDAFLREFFLSSRAEKGVLFASLVLTPGCQEPASPVQTKAVRLAR